jgi:hypothetical protein
MLKNTVRGEREVTLATHRLLMVRYSYNKYVHREKKLIFVCIYALQG